VNEAIKAIFGRIGSRTTRVLVPLPPAFLFPNVYPAPLLPRASNSCFKLVST